MNFTEEQYLDNLDYVHGIFTLGGLSECGKTTAGKRFQELGVRKSKIIHIEYEMMKERGVDINTTTPEDFENLYINNTESSFKEFLFRLIEKMKEEGFRFASLESLYRAPLGAFIKKEFGKKAANIYIDVPLEDRAYREMIKINKKAEVDGGNTLSLEEVIKKTTEKDEFKITRGALDVKTIADHIINNSKKVSKEEFIAQIDKIAKNMGVK